MDLTFKSVVKLLWCDHSSETSQVALYMELLFLSTFCQNLVEVSKVKALSRDKERRQKQMAVTTPFIISRELGVNSVELSQG